MLTNLRVQNFAIIDNLSIEFDSGLTVLTGETGAGKSLIIDAIGLLFGDRSSTSVIRYGESKAIVEGVFEKLSDKTKKVIIDFGIDLDEDMIVIKREVNISGKSMIRLNGEAITLSQLETLAFTLGDIHTQDDTKMLFLPENYLSFIDNTDSLNILSQYQTLRSIYLKNLKIYQSLLKDERDGETNKDFWSFQYQELHNAHLKVNELEELEKEIDYLNNYENIFNLYNQIKNTLEEQNVSSSLYEIMNTLEKLSKYQDKYHKDLDVISDAYYNIEDFENNIRNDLNHLEFDEDHLNALNERISIIKDLCRKYHRDVVGLIALEEELKEKINSIMNMDVYLEDAKKNVESSFNNLVNVVKNLTNIRKHNAKELVNNIKKTLHDLLLDKVEISIVFNDYNLTDFLNSTIFKNDGCDEIDILVSFNVGEAMKPLSRVASGGEMSRVMLALKVHLLNNLHLSTMIFDEIDSGVSGEVAAGVALKLREISEQTQVLSITHLPIVASFAKTQMLISKEIEAGRTITSIKKLTKEERINILAKMISPNDETNKSVELARSWLDK